MIIKLNKFCFYIFLLVVSSLDIYAISPGQKVPIFTLENEYGKKISLEKFKNKIVVLEWLNDECPFVEKHYASKNMQRLQAKFSQKEVVWLSVISSAKGKQGYRTPKQALEDKKRRSSLAAHILLDYQGDVGSFMGAKTTPHIFIIGKKQELLYQGAIDSLPSTDQQDIKRATNYVEQALDQILAGKDVAVKSTKPYGCSIKY